MTGPTIRSGNVSWLAEAWRHAGRSVLADTVLANRFRDFTRQERQAALAECLAEARARLIVAEAARSLAEVDPLATRLRSLLELADDELEELHRAGLLDDLGIDEL